MPTFADQILTLLVNQPGNLVYHLVLIFSIVGAMPGVLNLWQRDDIIEGRRALIGLALLLLIQIFLIIAAGLSFIIPSLGYYLPIISDVCAVLEIVLLMWIWVFPEPNRRTDLYILVLTLGIITLGFISIYLPGTLRSIDFYIGSSINQFWNLFSIVLVSIAGILVFVKRPSGYEFGIATFVILLIGYLMQFIWPLPGGDYPGFTRLAQIVVYPLLLTLPNRTPSTSPFHSISSSDSAGFMKRKGIDARVISHFMAFATSTQINDSRKAISAAIAYTFPADICLIISSADQHNLISVHCGFDLSRQEYIGAATFNSSMVPVLSESIRQGRPVHLPANSNVPDLVGLGNILHLALVGPLLAAPIFDSNKTVNGAVVLLSPYTKRTWTASDQNLLADISHSMTDVLNREQQAQIEADQLNQTKRAIQRLQNENQQLSLALQQMTISSTDQPNSVEELQSDLHLALAEIAILQQAIGANADIKDPTTSQAPNYQAIESIKVFSQGLLVPVNSISDTAEKILSGGVGAITNFQRVSLEQIRTNAQNIRSWLERVIETPINYKEVGPALARVDLNQIISDVFQDSDRKRIENNQEFNKVIDSALPPILSDPTALRIVISLLLHKASDLISPGGTVTLDARFEQNEWIAISVDGKNSDQLEQSINSSQPLSAEESETGLNQALQSDFDLLFAHSLVDRLEGELVESRDLTGAVSFALKIPARQVELPIHAPLGDS